MKLIASTIIDTEIRTIEASVSTTMRQLQSVLASVDPNITPEQRDEIVTAAVSTLGGLRNRLVALQEPLMATFAALKENILSTLRGMPKRDYIYAVNTWSSDVLNDMDVVIAEYIREVLREYFAGRDLNYAGWDSVA